jgi:rpsU-divergently transcribed protein
MLRHVHVTLTSFLTSRPATCGLQALISTDSRSSDVRQLLLDAAAQHVKQHGWSKASLVAAAKQLQLSPSCIGLCPRGGSEIVEHVIQQSNQQLAKELQANQQSLMNIPQQQRLAAAVRRRLELNIPYMEVWPQALAVLAQPPNSPRALQLLGQLVDNIWYAVGDTSTDTSWYRKRALLAGIYTTTEMYMLTDFSPGYVDTWQQLDRRVQDAMWLGDTFTSIAAAPWQLLQLLTQSSGAPWAATRGAPPANSSSTLNSTNSGKGTTGSFGSPGPDLAAHSSGQAASDRLSDGCPPVVDKAPGHL